MSLSPEMAAFVNEAKLRTRNCYLARTNLESQIASAQRALEANAVAWRAVQAMESRYRPYIQAAAFTGTLTMPATLVWGAYAPTVRTLAAPIGTAARMLEEQRAALRAAADSIARASRSIPEAVRQAFSRSDANTIASALRGAEVADAEARAALVTYRGTRWGLNDPAERPLFLGPAFPEGGASIAEEVYRLFVGTEYATRNPLPPVPTLEDLIDPDRRRQQTPWAAILSIGAGLVGSILIIKWLRERG